MNNTFALGQFVRILKPSTDDDLHSEAVRRLDNPEPVPEGGPASYPFAVSADYKGRQNTVGRRGVIIFIHSNCVHVSLYNETSHAFDYETYYRDMSCFEGIDAPWMKHSFKELVRGYVERKEREKNAFLESRKIEQEYISSLADKYDLLITQASELYRDISQYHGAEVVLDKEANEEYQEIDKALCDRIMGEK